MLARNEQVQFQNLQDPQQAPQVQAWQEHSTHYDEHIKVLKSLSFRSWSPQGQQAFMQHVQQTEQVLNEQAQAEAQAMIDQERELRSVREQEELKADVQRSIAEAAIELVFEQAGITIQEVVSQIADQQGESETSSEE